VKADLLHQEFEPRRVPLDPNRFLLAPHDALDLIDRASEEGVPIVSVNVVQLNADRSEPLAPPADFSAGVAGGHGCWTDAEAFIRSRAERPVAFELTLGDDPLEVV